MNDLSVVLHDFKDVVVQGETIRIYPIKIGQLKEALKSINAIVPLMGDFINSGRVEFVALSGYLENLEPLILLITNKTKEWFDNLNPLELTQIVCAIIELNFNFFFLKVVPELTKTAEALTKQISGQGHSTN